MLLSKIDGADMNENNREMYRSEALFLRGYFYYMLVTHFGDVPLVLEPTLTAEDAIKAVPRTPSATI